MITAVALCPAAPLLFPGVTGRTVVLPELSSACGEAVGRLVRSAPETVVVVGPAAVTGDWDGDEDGRAAPAVFAPGLRGAPGGPGRLPAALGLGAVLLDEAGYRGARRLRAVGHDEDAGACAKLGAALGETPGRTALLVMADGSARRTLRAPGYLDPRAGPFDADVERAVRSGDLGALRELDQGLARELMATGWPAWQVLAGALGARPRSRSLAAEVLYCDAPFGVGYLVASLAVR